MIGSIIIEPPDGLVFLTNQYQPNPSLTLADILIAGEGISRLGAEFPRLGIDARGFEGNGSSVVLDSRGNIFLAAEANIDSAANRLGRGGDIRLIANENIFLGDFSFVNTSFDSGQSGGGGDISLTGVNASGGGDIQIQGNRLLMQNYSNINSFTGGAEGEGNIFIRTNDSIDVDGGNIATSVLPQASGNGGDITIETRELTARGAELYTGDPLLPNGLLTGGDISTDTAGAGDAGDLTINARQIRLTDGAQVRASTLSSEDRGGTGSAGDITVRASDFVEVTGISSLGNQPSKIASQVNSGATGTGGDLLIETGRLIVGNGAQIQAGTFSTSPGGSLTVNAAQSVDIFDTVIDDNPTGLFTGPEGAAASGTGGDLTVRTEQLSILGGETDISSEVDPEASGSSGNLLIETNRLIVGDGARISASTFGTGQGGTLTVNASESIALFGIDNTVEDGEPSGLFTATFGGGNAGDLTVRTGRLSISDGATVSTSTRGLLGNGKSGDLTIVASKSVEVIGESPNGELSSSIVAEAGSLLKFINPSSTAPGGNLTIATGQLTVQDEAEISTETFGVGNAGDLSINASESVRLFDSDLRTRTSGSGDAGDLNITTGQLLIQGNAEATASTVEGQGRGGDIVVTASDSVELIGEAGLGTVSLLGGDAGKLTIQTNRLTVRDGAGVSTAAVGTGQAGDLNIAASDSVEVIEGRFATGSELDFIHSGSRKGSKIRTVMLNEF